MEKKLTLIIVSGLLFSFVPAFLFVPVTNIGDGQVYINYALKISGENISQNFISRSPLYPVFLAAIIKTAGISRLPQVAIFIQFFLNFLSSLLLTLILKRIMSIRLALFSAILFYLNLSTLFFGYMILSEALTVFIFLSVVYILTIWIDNGLNLTLAFLGVFVSFLIFVRFNTLPLIFTFLILILIISIIKAGQFDLLKASQHFLWFSIPFLVIINIYSYFNYRTNHFYGIFPYGGSPTITRNAILATIDGNEEVTAQNQDLFNIFLKGRQNFYSRKIVEKKGSLQGFTGIRIIEKLYSGYQIYLGVLPELCNYYKIDPMSPEPSLSKKLEPFYKEIRSQKTGKLWEMRLFSLLNSFRSSTGIVISGGGSKSLNLLPGWLIILYKLVIIAADILIFIASIGYLIHIIIFRQGFNPYLLSLVLLFLSFYFINFIFGTVGDANRFKYPSEPLMIGLFVYMVKLGHNRLKSSV